jgi:hypothetical protein
VEHPNARPLLTQDNTTQKDAEICFSTGIKLLVNVGNKNIAPFKLL